MGGRMTATINSNGDVCSIQKAGGEGVTSSVIMQCLRIASVKAADITSKIKSNVSQQHHFCDIANLEFQMPALVFSEI
jgi:exosome complex RNA-binding protein Rrp42 (RNase PH superfamily)